MQSGQVPGACKARCPRRIADRGGIQTESPRKASFIQKKLFTKNTAGCIGSSPLLRVCPKPRKPHQDLGNCMGRPHVTQPLFSLHLKPGEHVQCKDCGRASAPTRAVFKPVRLARDRMQQLLLGPGMQSSRPTCSPAGRSVAHALCSTNT